MPPDLPSVSALVPAYNYERYVERAVCSALAQDYPADLLDVVVVDDGSTDATAAIVEDIARRHPGRVRLVQQANAGATSAINRAIAEARGDLLAILDADDVWQPDKTRRQVEMLQARPELGLVFCDMAEVDADENVTMPSRLAWLGPAPQLGYVQQLRVNVVTQSSIMIRASLRSVFAPIPLEIPYSDWWLGLRAAEVSEIDFVHETLALYRVHGANLTGSVSGASAVREHCKEVAFQLWALRHLPLDRLTPAEMLFVWRSVEEHAEAALGAAGSHFVQLVDLHSHRPAEVSAWLSDADRARDAGDPHAEAALVLRALAADPYRSGSRERLAQSVQSAQAHAALPDPLAGARDVILIADAEDLLGGDELLLAFARELGDSEAVTLAIDASRLPADIAERDLRALVQRCELSDRDDIDLLAVTGPLGAPERARMMKRAQALYRLRTGEAAELPVVTPSTLGELLAASTVGRQH